MPSVFVPLKVIDVTRRGVPPVKTPDQAVGTVEGVVDIAVDAFQLRVASPRRVSFRSQRTLQSATSSAFAVGLGTTVPFSHGCVCICPKTLNDTKRSVNSIAATPAVIPHRIGRPDEGG